jgi:GNAT superfamily N-acetyltransferase
MKIKIAETEEEIKNCYAVMSQLRPHLSLEKFFAQVKRQIEQSNFQLVYLSENEVKAVAGIRIAEWLARGKSLEIEDLVSKENERSKGFGGELFDWIVEYAKRENCVEVRLVSGVTRYRAHKFYLKKGMIIAAHFLSLEL